ncbi:uncharacterized protein BDZ99DRAFT_466336 [Mytilinidion resinicola]|uniref:Uncharacterized protein n=1 Tax=Mytilinidion resinicola TaxID=574789 RepID=A0A6A6YBQ9_9PEZI|nr:uncharacterized protein BDZ99DRAFT_466336 [Mytilinidion resinicola]KAF2806049.1 hypothetical protein BDZ99DRAFT_466336 [Mytilinidion resinicola]
MQSQFVVGALRAQLPAIKQLFLRGQYRQCAAAAQSLLLEISRDEPRMHVAFLHFYVALSHHETSRNMRILNDQRQSSLELAEKHYVAALESLYMLPTTTELETIDEVSDHSGDEDSMVESCNPSNRSSINHKRSSLDSSLTDDTSVYSDDESDSAFPPTPKMFNRSPPSRNFLDDLTLPSQKLFRNPSLTSIPSPEIERYNVNLTSFTSMLHSHIYAVRSLQKAQAAEDTGHSISQGWHAVPYTSSGPRYSGTAKNGSKFAHFVRGRAKLLPRQRFDSRKYEDLCRKALAEL